MTTRAPLAFTCGDPAGVGPEIIEAWIAAHPNALKDVAVIGPARWAGKLASRGVHAVAVGEDEFSIEAGHPTIDGARVALAAMERAAEGTQRGEFSGVVTGPVSKSWLQKAGYVFPGQTEFFAARWGGEPTMAFCGGRLRLVLLTWHIPFRDVPGQLTEANIVRAVRAAAELARADGVTEPRIAVCGLNPHAGEDGLLGHEERDVIEPVLAKYRAEFPGLSRCEPGDTVFARALRGEFDVTIALYHDQGLAPLKTIDFDTAVNVTLGLPHVRTSPDHGTAFGIAGRGLASAASFTNAVTVARRLIKLRSAQ
mgnify:CR=1 FL=1|jgi:4-hydroxythreonine-4-phosphate dehydrogenase